MTSISATKRHTLILSDTPKHSLILCDTGQLGHGEDNAILDQTIIPQTRHYARMEVWKSRAYMDKQTETRHGDIAGEKLSIYSQERNNRGEGMRLTNASTDEQRAYRGLNKNSLVGSWWFNTDAVCHRVFTGLTWQHSSLSQHMSTSLWDSQHV